MLGSMGTRSIFNCLAIGLYSSVCVGRKSNIHTINRSNDLRCDENGICFVSLQAPKRLACRYDFDYLIL